MTIPMILTLLGQGLLYTLRLVALIGLGSAKWLMWLLWPAWLVAAVLGAALAFFTGPAKAGWLDGFWGPDPKIEAANHALQQAAKIATEAARTQSSQQSQLLAAIEALSNERVQIAGQLGRLGEMATRDSTWAAALEAFGPVLIVVAVLAVGCVALWLVTRSGPQDAQLAAVLVDELTGTGTGVLSGPPHREAITAGAHDHTASLGYEEAISDLTPQESPF